MAQFMLLIRGGYKAYQDYTPEQIQQSIDKYRRWSQSLRANRQYISAEKLRDDGGGRRLSSRDGQVVLDGPFTETKETIGGYFVIEAADYDQALALALACPNLAASDGSLEIRAIEA